MTAYEHVCVFENQQGPWWLKRRDQAEVLEGMGHGEWASGNFGFTLGEKRGFSIGEICILDNPLAPGLRTDAGGQV